MTEPAEFSKTELQALRLRAVARYPYLATALWSMTLVQMPGSGTMGVDKRWRLYIDPAVKDKWTTEQLTGVLVHEVEHLIRGHHKRAASLGIVEKEGVPVSTELQIRARIWNMAGDISINQDLMRERMVKLPDEVLKPEDYEFPLGETTEWYYAELMKKVENGEIKIVVQMSGSAPLEGHDGSGASGVSAPWELGKDGKQKNADGTETDQGQGVSEAEGELIRHKVAQDVQEEAKKNIGNVPGYMQRWADEKLNPKVDWRTKLTSAIRGQLAQTRGMVDYSYRRPSRRCPDPRIRLPSFYAPMPDVGVGIDTSGSMDTSDIKLAMAEVRGVLEAVNCVIRVYVGDTMVYKEQRVRSLDQIELTGGGGTDMGAIIQAMDEDKVHFGIVLTDGYTPWPKQKPKHLNKVIVCLTRESEKSNVPEFYEVVMVEHDAKTRN